MLAIKTTATGLVDLWHQWSALEDEALAFDRELRRLASLGRDLERLTGMTMTAPKRAGAGA